MGEILELQLVMFTYMIVGAVLKKIGIINESGKKSLTDIVINVILPCNIVKSFLVEFNWNIIYKFLLILIISSVVQGACTLIGKFTYIKYNDDKKVVLKYATVCSNAAFLGNAIIESVMGVEGVSYASIYMIPQRIVMWSAGISYFASGSSRKNMIKKVLLHPCMIAVYIGIFCLFTDIWPWGFMNRVITGFSSCTMPISMIVIGSIVSDIKMASLKNMNVLYFSLIRLIIIPAITFLICILLKANVMITGVSVLLAAMPAGTTTVIFAEKYKKESEMASQIVIVSTILSLLTLPIWKMLVSI